VRVRTGAYWGARRLVVFLCAPQHCRKPVNRQKQHCSRHLASCPPAGWWSRSGDSCSWTGWTCAGCVSGGGAVGERAGAGLRPLRGYAPVHCDSRRPQRGPCQGGQRMARVPRSVPRRSGLARAGGRDTAARASLPAPSAGLHTARTALAAIPQVRAIRRRPSCTAAARVLVGSDAAAAIPAPAPRGQSATPPATSTSSRLVGTPAAPPHLHCLISPVAVLSSRAACAPTTCWLVLSVTPVS
jgi:hypothetical protein